MPRLPGNRLARRGGAARSCARRALLLVSAFEMR